jgi:acetyl coenzyme A synthetase (ADP forming)-like protein
VPAVELRPPGYPERWAVDAVLADGGTVHIRPLRPDDAPAYRTFFAKLSPETVYFRFFSHKTQLSDAEVEHFTRLDYHDRMAFVALLRDEIIAVGRYDRMATSDRAEVAFVVSDRHQGRGIGSILLEYLAAYARDEGITRFVADTLAENRRMLDVFHAAGYRREGDARSAGVIRVAFDIEPTGASITAIERREWTAGVHSIERMLRPRSVAVIGAGRDPGGIGHAVLRNLITAGFTGPVYPINPQAASIDGVPAFPGVEDVAGEVDLAILAVPAARCLDAVDACARKGVGGLVVISSGFAETGQEGAALQRELLLRAHRGGMRVVGPNCFGVINTAPDVRLDATFASLSPTRGGLAFASQSGALGIAVLERSVAAELGLSSFVSMGNKADVSSNDLLRYWSQDGVTRAILLYLESFGNARAFARLAPTVSRHTPIVAVKSGRSVAGRRAAASHTAALASPDLAADALFHQAGVIRVDTLEDLLDCGALLAQQPRLAGNRLLIVGNAGGAAVLAADACAAAGMEVPELASAAQQRLRQQAGPNAGVSNPIDLGAGASAALFAEAVETALSLTELDAVMAILAPVAGLDAEDVAHAVADVDAGERPVVFVHLGSDAVPAALHQAGRAIPCYAFPERAVRALGRIAEHARWCARDPGVVPELGDVDLGAARVVVDSYLHDVPNGGWLPPSAVRGLLQAFAIPVVSEVEVRSADAAGQAARQVGFPCVLKAVGEQIVHKADVGGVRLGLRSAAEVRRQYREMSDRLGDAMRGAVLQPMLSGVETIAGVVSDPLFGPLIMFGSGGTAVELFGDRSFRILPLTDVDAAELVRSIRGAPRLFGYRGAPACDVAAVEDVLLRVARLADDVPQLAEMDLNPLMATPDGAVAVDSRIRIVPWRRHGEQEVRRLR